MKMPVGGLPIEYGAKYYPKEYQSFMDARRRCINPSDKQYKNYGGRGIEFRLKSLEELIKHIGRKPTPKHGVDRINNDGHYEIGNIRWLTTKEQMRNVRYNRWLEYNGERLILHDWSLKVKIGTGTIGQRLARGWSVGQALGFQPRAKGSFKNKTEFSFKR